MTTFDLLKLREWLTVDEAARWISDITGQPVSGASVLRFAIDRRLRLSVNFVNKTYAHLGRALPVADFEFSSQDASEAVPRRVVLWRGEESTYGALINDREVVQLSGEIASVEGLWDLPMIGGELLDVENEYQQLTGGPTVRGSGGPDLTLVHRIDGSWGQLLMNGGDEVPPSRPSPESLRLKRSFSDPCTSSDAEDAEALGEIPPGPWFLAPSLPKDGVFVVRAEALREFVRSEVDKVNACGTTADSETNAFAARVQDPRPPTNAAQASPKFVGGPKLASWLAAEMAKRECMTPNSLHVQTDLDRKTINKMLAGKPVAEVRRRKLARGLKVPPSDIPTD